MVKCQDSQSVRALSQLNVGIIVAQEKLDAANYQELIDRAQELIDNGAEMIFIDMSRTRSISNCGLFALYDISALLHGEMLLPMEMGWHRPPGLVGMPAKVGARKLKVIQVQPAIQEALLSLGFEAFLEIYPDLETAVTLLRMMQ